MPTDKILSAEAFTAEVSKWAARLAKGKKNLSALKAAAANPKTSPVGKKTMEEMIVRQAQINAKLEKLVALLNGAPEDKR
jgi:hypothetical protein